MLEESTEAARDKIEETEGSYQPPALVVLGSLEDLTGSTTDDGSVVGDFSDRILKEQIEPFGNAIGHLRAVQSR